MAIAAGLGGAWAGPAAADPVLAGAEPASMLDLAKARNCLACHSVERKVVGPSFKEVAQRYAGSPSASDKLAAKVVKGGAGAWSAVPMPANPQVSQAEAEQLTAWILGMK